MAMKAFLQIFIQLLAFSVQLSAFHLSANPTFQLFTVKPSVPLQASESDSEDNENSSPSFRQFRADLISQGLDYGNSKSHKSNHQWAHRLSKVELGSVILESRLIPCPENQEYFEHAAILIIQHDEIEGTIGLILNQPTKYVMGEMVNDAHLRALPGFERSILYMGGDVGKNTRLDGKLCMDTINLVHEKQYVQAVKITDGLYYGGLNEALEDVQIGNAMAEDFKFFTKYCGWAPGQLDAEVEQGYWVIVATDTKTILDQTPGSLPKDMWTDIISRLK